MVWATLWCAIRTIPEWLQKNMQLMLLVSQRAAVVSKLRLCSLRTTPESSVSSYFYFSVLLPFARSTQSFIHPSMHVSHPLYSSIRTTNFVHSLIPSTYHPFIPSSFHPQTIRPSRSFHASHFILSSSMSSQSMAVRRSAHNRVLFSSFIPEVTPHRSTVSEVRTTSEHVLARSRKGTACIHQY